MGFDQSPSLIAERENGLDEFKHHCALGYAVVADLRGISAEDPIDQMALERAVRITQILHLEYSLEPIVETAAIIAEKLKDDDARARYFEVARAANQRTEGEVE